MKLLVIVNVCTRVCVIFLLTSPDYGMNLGSKGSVGGAQAAAALQDSQELKAAAHTHASLKLKLCSDRSTRTNMPH